MRSTPTIPLVISVTFTASLIINLVRKKDESMKFNLPLLALMIIMILLGGCRPPTPVSSELPPPIVESLAPTHMAQTREIIEPSSTATFEPSPTATQFPACYQTELPGEIASSYAILGWRAFAAQAGFDLTYYYFPTDCSPDSLEQDIKSLLSSELVPVDEVGLLILNPVDSGTLGRLYQHLAQHEYWQMGPEDYPALLEDSTGVNRNLIFLRVDELNGDQTIIGNPLIVLTSLAEHEYIHVAQSRNNPDLATMVWMDKDYQYFIEGYANIGNASSQRYYFETQDAITMLQNLDLMNRSGELQPRIAEALQDQGSDVTAFLAAGVPVYDRHIEAFFLRVGGQAYLDGLRQGEVSPYTLFTRAGSGDLMAYKVIREILKK
jgi:hypothetical protein